MDPWELAAKGGIFGLCLLTIYLGWKREERTAAEHLKQQERSAAAFEKLNDRQHETQVQIIAQLTQLNLNSKALHEEIKSRPCVQDPWNGHDRRTK